MIGKKQFIIRSGTHTLFKRQMSNREAASFCRRFGVGYRSGVNLLRLLDTEAKFGTARHREVLGRVRNSAADGGTLHEAMKRDEDYFPALNRGDDSSGRSHRLTRSHHVVAGGLLRRASQDCSANF